MASKDEFVKQYTPLAEQIGKEIGVAPELILGQLGLETGWGKSVIPGTNNLGNIKSFGLSGVKARDNMTGSTDKYRKYATAEEFGSDYASLLKRKYPDAIGAGNDATKFATGLKKGGYAEDPNYVSKVVSAAGSLMGKLGDMVIPSAAAAEQDPFAGYKPTKKAEPVQQAPAQQAPVQAQPINSDDPFAGFTPKKKAAPVEQALVQQAPVQAPAPTPQPEQGTGQQLLSGAKNLGLGLVRGARDLIDGPAYLLASAFDKTGLTSGEGKKVSDINKQAEEEYQAATPGSVAAGTGRVAGNVAGAFIPGLGAGKAATAPSLARLATEGAAWGAAATRTEDDSLLGNTIAGAVTGPVANKLISTVANPLGRQVAADAPGLIAQAEKHGLPVSAANVASASTPSMMAEKLIGTTVNHSPAQVEAVNKAIAGQIGKGVGVPGAQSVDSALVNQSHPYAAFDNLTQGTQIPLSGGRLHQDLGPALAQYQRNVTDQNGALLSEVNGLFNHAQTTNGVNPTFTPQEMQMWKSGLGQRLENASGADRQLISAARDAIDSQMTPRLSPEQLSAFNTGNQQYRNLKVVEDVVRKARDNNEKITPARILEAAKNSQGFSKGEAPYQELAQTLTKLYGEQGIKHKDFNWSPSNIAKWLGYGSAAWSTGGVGAALPVAEHLANKALTSQNPTVRNAVVGNTKLQEQVRKAADSKELANALAFMAANNTK